MIKFGNKFTGYLTIPSCSDKNIAIAQKETAIAYILSANKLQKPYIPLSKNINEILNKYFAYENKKFYENICVKGFENKKISTDENKIGIAFTGGKDCVYLLIKLIEEGYKKKNIYCFYVTNINKSESYYEKIAADKICKYFGVNFRIINCKVSVKINRENHNIGLREQLIIGLMLPYLKYYRIRTVMFGIKSKIVSIASDDFFIFDKYEEYLNEIIELKIESRPKQVCDETDLSIAISMDKNYRSILDMTASCYTQLNFRERRHNNLAKKFAFLPIYNGCGLCQKCMIINGAIFLNRLETLNDAQKTLWSKWYYERASNSLLIRNKDVHDCIRLMKIRRN